MDGVIHQLAEEENGERRRRRTIDKIDEQRRLVRKLDERCAQQPAIVRKPQIEV